MKKDPELVRNLLWRLQQSAGAFVASSPDSEWAVEGLEAALDAADQFAQSMPTVRIEVPDMVGIAKFMALLAVAEDGSHLVEELLERLQGGPAELIRTIMYAIVAQLAGAELDQVRTLIRQLSLLAGISAGRAAMA